MTCSETINESYKLRYASLTTLRAGNEIHPAPTGYATRQTAEQHTVLVNDSANEYSASLRSSATWRAKNRSVESNHDVPLEESIYATSSPCVPSPSRESIKPPPPQGGTNSTQLPDSSCLSLPRLTASRRAPLRLTDKCIHRSCNRSISRACYALPHAFASF